MLKIVSSRFLKVIYWLMRRRPSQIYDALLHGNIEWMILLPHYNTAVTLTKHKHGRRILRAEVDQPATTDQLKPGREGTYENTLDYACVSSSVINVRLHRSIHRIFHLRHSIVSSFCQGKTFFITSWSPSNQSGKTARAVYSSWAERYFTCHTDRLLTYPGVSLLSVSTQASAWYYPLLIICNLTSSWIVVQTATLHLSPVFRDRNSGWEVDGHLNLGGGGGLISTNWKKRFKLR